MNQTLLLVLAWLPVVAESGLFIAVAKFLASKLKEHFSTPKKLTEEIKEVKSQLVANNKNNIALQQENELLREELHKCILEMRGIKANESIKKN